MTKVKPKASLCDGTFHKISGKKPQIFNTVWLSCRTSTQATMGAHVNSMCPPVIQRKNVVQLNVDTVDNYKVGPPLSTHKPPKGSLYVGGVPGE